VILVAALRACTKAPRKGAPSGSRDSAGDGGGVGDRRRQVTRQRAAREVDRMALPRILVASWVLHSAPVADPLSRRGSGFGFSSRPYSRAISQTWEGNNGCGLRHCDLYGGLGGSLLPPVIRILDRIGHNRWFAVMAVIPLMNLFGLWMLAFSKWPSWNHHHQGNSTNGRLPIMQSLKSFSGSSAIPRCATQGSRGERSPPAMRWRPDAGTRTRTAH